MDRPTQYCWLRPLTAILCALALCGSGCTTLNFGKKAEDEAYREMADTDDVVGPLERMLTFRKKKNELKYIPGYHEKGQPEFQAAQALFDAGKHEEAGKAAKKIAKEFERYAVREDAMFLMGDVFMKQQKYPEAQDTFDQLVQDYPATHYKDEISRRMFVIAGTWLQFPDIVTPSDIQQVSNLEDVPKSKVPPSESDSWDPTRKLPLLPNFHDNSRPVFDTPGRALQALKSIWRDNPTSPLADDALMMTASHYMRSGQHEQADDYFAILRTHYPKSPHFENAYVLGSHVKLMSYQGPEYDGARLNEAAQLKDSYLRMYPNGDYAARAERDLKIIDEAAAEREWEQVRFYMKKGRPDAAVIYAREVLRLYPGSKVAANARQFLSEHNDPTANKSSGGWDWNFFPKLERVPESPPTEESSGKTSVDLTPTAPPRTTPDPNYE